MPTQTYATHRHNPQLTTVGFVLVLLAAVAFGLQWINIVGGRLFFGAGLACLLAAVVVLLLISRFYITRLQDRIIKLEMKIRCAALLSPAQLETFARLTTPQLVALRFASDAELPALLERAERDRLTADQIKRSIATWVPDLDRT
jgi:uncharacterized protein DUF6526